MFLVPPHPAASLGVVVALTIVVFAVGGGERDRAAAVFAAVLAVCFKPLVGALARKGISSAAAPSPALVVSPSPAFVAFATFRGVAEQTSEIGDSVDAAIETVVDQICVDEESLQTVREAVEQGSPAVGGGFLTELSGGVNKVIGLASGLILGALIMYYLLQDGSKVRRSVVGVFDPTVQRGDG